MTRSKPAGARGCAWVVAFAATFCVGALAQGVSPNPAGGAAQRNAPATTPASAAAPARPAGDMRLWSFGDCDRAFPYVSSDEHKACVRVVGSEEARDARALRVCETSHEKDRAEAERCKAAYRANKAQAAQDGLVPNAAAKPPAPVPPEVIERVRAIAAVAVEHDRAAAAEAAGADAPAPAAPQEIAAGQTPPLPIAVQAAAFAEPRLPAAARPAGFWSPATTIGVLSAFVLVVGVVLKVARKKALGGAQY